MVGKYSALQKDCLTVIKKCNKLIMAARLCQARCIMDDPGGVVIQTEEMHGIASDLAKFCETINFESI